MLRLTAALPKTSTDDLLARYRWVRLYILMYLYIIRTWSRRCERLTCITYLLAEIVEIIRVGDVHKNEGVFPQNSDSTRGIGSSTQCY